MRFLVDEMFGPHVAALLRERGHDATHVRDAGLTGAPDDRVLAQAAAEGRVVVTENASDFVPLLDARTAAAERLVPVVIALKSRLPRDAGAMAAELAQRLDRWATEPDPYLHAHWLPD